MLIHFLKRELKTTSVHRFSNVTTPFRNVFKNSFHYWTLSGLLLSWSYYRPVDAGSESDRSTRIYAGLVVFAIGELANFTFTSSCVACVLLVAQNEEYLAALASSG